MGSESSATGTARTPSGVLEAKKSFRVQQQIVEDLFEEFGHIPVVVMARKDALKAQQEENVLKSNKQYLKEPITRRIKQRMV